MRGYHNLKQMLNFIQRITFRFEQCDIWYNLLVWRADISMLLEQGDIEVCVEGSFNNYVNPILPNFNPLPPSSGQTWTFQKLSTLCHMTPLDFPLAPFT